MGTGFDVSVSEAEKGIIPRAVHQLFDGINTQRNEAVNKSITPPEFKIVAQFMEVSIITQHYICLTSIFFLCMLHT